MSREKLTVLLVDDDADTVDSYATWLRMRGAIALCGRSVRDAWAILESIAVDVIVTDLAMPGEGGVVLAERVRADERFQALPLIAISGFHRASERPTVLRAGFDAFHVKPVPPRVLEADIDSLVHRRAPPH